MQRRTLLLAGAGAILAACSARSAATPGPARPARAGFVGVDGQRFVLDGAPYRYVGANMWYGAYLGADAGFGNRDRLRRELDALTELGIANIRVLASGEISPLRNSLNPAFRDRSSYNDQLLTGLDFLLAEMGQRNLRAVLYLTNFWEWSGGMVTYLYWTNGGRYINMNDPAHPWPEFPDFSAHFYSSAEAKALYDDYVRAIVGRANSVNGKAYKDDPTIMAWQLANEPRPGGSEAFGTSNLPAFYAWIADTAKLIKSLDPDHLVSTGNEGLKGCLEQAQCVLAAHQAPEVDYLTAHIWPQNWSWADPNALERSYPTVETNTQDYINQHVGFARQLNKPLVIEEFGFPRDDLSYAPGSPTTLKDRFYALIYRNVMESAEGDGPLAGSNFWAWGGAGRAQHPDLHWRTGDRSYVGDPPHEPQGWYSVFDNDRSTLGLIRDHAAALKTIRA
ncbi:MAG TPA: cellulase family glycosylhydrolase [Caulobacterales bacterium]|nr:cellulase family glycosylhydrolase [Caulobacterales bacterium]